MTEHVRKHILDMRQVRRLFSVAFTSTERQRALRKALKGAPVNVGASRLTSWQGGERWLFAGPEDDVRFWEDLGEFDFEEGPRNNPAGGHFSEDDHSYNLKFQDKAIEALGLKKHPLGADWQVDAWLLKNGDYNPADRGSCEPGGCGSIWLIRDEDDSYLLVKRWYVHSDGDGGYYRLPRKHRDEVDGHNDVVIEGKKWTEAAFDEADFNRMLAFVRGLLK